MPPPSEYWLHPGQHYCIEPLDSATPGAIIHFCDCWKYARPSTCHARSLSLAETALQAFWAALTHQKGIEVSKGARRRIVGQHMLRQVQLDFVLLFRRNNSSCPAFRCIFTNMFHFSTRIYFTYLAACSCPCHWHDVAYLRRPRKTLFHISWETRYEPN